MAALESKIQQYEREVDRLKRALERSDQYIEDLEVKVSESERRPSDQREAVHPHTGACPEITIPGDGEAGARGQVRHQRIATMRRSLSDVETASLFTNREGESETLPGDRSYLLTTSTGLPAFSDKFPEQRGLGARRHRRVPGVRTMQASVHVGQSAGGSQARARARHARVPGV